jgi:hypothetical protein
MFDPASTTASTASYVKAMFTLLDGSFNARTGDSDSHRSRKSKRTGLFDGDLHLLDSRVFETDVCEFLDETFDKHRLTRLDMGDHRLGDRPIVDRIVDVIRLGRDRRVREEFGVDKDRLLVDAFIGIDTDDAFDRKVLDEYTVECHGSEATEPKVS